MFGYDSTVAQMTTNLDLVIDVPPETNFLDALTRLRVSGYYNVEGRTPAGCPPPAKKFKVDDEELELDMSCFDFLEAASQGQGSQTDCQKRGRGRRMGR